MPRVEARSRQKASQIAYEDAEIVSDSQTPKEKARFGRSHVHAALEGAGASRPSGLASNLRCNLQD